MLEPPLTEAVEHRVGVLRHVPAHRQRHHQHVGMAHRPLPRPGLRSGGCVDNQQVAMATKHRAQRRALVLAEHVVVGRIGVPGQDLVVGGLEPQIRRQLPRLDVGRHQPRCVVEDIPHRAFDGCGARCANAEGAAGLAHIHRHDPAAAMLTEHRCQRNRRRSLAGSALGVDHSDRARTRQRSLDRFDRRPVAGLCRCRLRGQFRSQSCIDPTPPTPLSRLGKRR